MKAMSKCYHTRTTLSGHVTYKGATIKIDDHKRAVYHSQRGANSRSKKTVIVQGQIDNAHGKQVRDARAHDLKAGREDRRKLQRLERIAKRAQRAN